MNTWPCLTLSMPTERKEKSCPLPLQQLPEQSIQSDLPDKPPESHLQSTNASSAPLFPFYSVFCEMKKAFAISYAVL